MTAHKQQQTNGVKSNRLFNKPDFVTPHKPSKIDLKDERVVKVEIRLVHPHRSVMVKTIEMYKLESERVKWAKDGYELLLNN